MAADGVGGSVVVMKTRRWIASGLAAVAAIATAATATTAAAAVTTPAAAATTPHAYTQQDLQRETV